MNARAFALLVSAFTCFSSMAEIDDFAGPSVGASYTFIDSSFQRVYNNTSLTASATDQALVFKGKYFWSLDRGRYLGMGFDYGSQRYRAGAIGSSVHYVNRTATLSLLPAVRVGSEYLLYGKLAYAYGEGKTSTGTKTQEGNGWQYGVGLLRKLGSNFYGEVELSRTDYDDMSSGSVTYMSNVANRLAMGIGYRF